VRPDAPTPGPPTGELAAILGMLERGLSGGPEDMRAIAETFRRLQRRLAELEEQLVATRRQAEEERVRLQERRRRAEEERQSLEQRERTLEELRRSWEPARQPQQDRSEDPFRLLDSPFDD
jgi:chromosome segregation ATPase